MAVFNKAARTWTPRIFNMYAETVPVKSADGNRVSEHGLAKLEYARLKTIHGAWFAKRNIIL